MKLFSIKRVFLAAAVFTFGTLGSVEWARNDCPSVEFIRGDFTVTTSTANAGEASGHSRRNATTSALPPIATKLRTSREVRFVPIVLQNS